MKQFSQVFVVGGADKEMMIDDNQDETISTFSTHNEIWHKNKDETM